MRPQEKWCRDEFDAHVASRVPHATREWNPGTDPPDLFLDSGGVRFAVEVSRLADEVTDGERRFPEQTFNRSTNGLLDDIEAAASSRGILSGSYVIWFSNAIPNFGREAARIRSVALEYISATQFDSYAKDRDLFPSSPGLVSIRKLSDSGSVVGGGWDSGDAQWEGEIIQGAEAKLTRKLNEKLHKLRLVSGPRIVLIENTLGLAPAVPHAFETYRPTPDHSQFYDGIFILSRSARVIEIHLKGDLARILGASTV